MYLPLFDGILHFQDMVVVDLDTEVVEHVGFEFYKERDDDYFFCKTKINKFI